MVLTFLWIRRSLWQSLILFFFLIACSDRGDKTGTISILWENERATGLRIPRSYFLQTPDDSIEYVLEISLLSNGDQPAMLGEYNFDDDAVVFEPLIPLTRGLTYEVKIEGRSISQIVIPVADRKDTPEVVSIYPTQDTLPHNLLKVYLEFSRPMVEGQSLQHITIVKNGKDTIPYVFLDLQPELWNNDGTLLTLWLDPGRIKRDLQPNQRLGEPLEVGANYQLSISSEWNDTQGAFLQQDYTKTFFVTTRDSLSPEPNKWIIRVPEAGTKKPVDVEFNEPLDRVLLNETIILTDSEGNAVQGVIELKDEEATYSFTPDKPWQKGSYQIQCEGRLEDLAGNNLNRPFDRDITGKSLPASKEVFTRRFQINF